MTEEQIEEVRRIARKYRRQVALNGFHQGVVVQIETELGRVEIVFDNLYPDGIPKQEWVNSFGGPLVEDFNGQFTVMETEF
ncbi:papain fold toxin domain-containing protein [Aerosakkonema funiforme]|uniref:Tox-PL-2 domain-containing protein n=1 Tax=Aerosakkonema funiforme FACHB-1375 TaxID=2949571 RepID=A0A926VK04_9CYAN|nr:papain fold toxin domain-containing protein [Aerosakkonema funiforme]MBD2183854.1 hypothetical protein [Aerosakkonema funiforme FACHB-1375]